LNSEYLTTAQCSSSDYPDVGSKDSANVDWCMCMEPEEKFVYNTFNCVILRIIYEDNGWDATLD
jgi:hypothetical protein